MNWVIPQSFGAISKRFREVPVENSLAGGIQSSFGVVSYKGRQWSIRYRGTTTPLMAENGRDPAFSIEVVILKSSPTISKTFYDHAYVEGQTDPPDCMSMNGQVPDAASPKKQAVTCAVCPNNVWGSRQTPDGRSAKACADNKRLAVGLMPNLLDERFGGPLLLRVPPASLQALASYGNALAQHGYHEHAVVTRLSFDMKEAYPRFVWEPVRPLSDNEADLSIELRNSAEVSRILAEALEYVTPAEAGASFFQQPQPSSLAQATPVSTEEALGRAVTVRKPRAPRPQTIQGQAVPATAPKSEVTIHDYPGPVQGPPTNPLQLAEQENKASAEENPMPAFLRKPNGKPVAEEVPDEEFEDDIDAKLAAMLP